MNFVCPHCKTIRDKSINFTDEIRKGKVTFCGCGEFSILDEDKKGNLYMRAPNQNEAERLAEKEPYKTVKKYLAP